MPPRLASNYIPNRVRSDVVAIGQNTSRFTLAVCSANGDDGIFGELGHGMFAATAQTFRMQNAGMICPPAQSLRMRMRAMAAPRCRSTFASHVLGVIGGRPEPKMIGATAKSVVTFMQDKNIGWDGTIGQFIGHATGVESMPTEPKLTIAIRALTSRPQPTLSRPIDLRPKTIKDTDLMSRILICHALPPMRHYSTGVRL